MAAASGVGPPRALSSFASLAHDALASTLSSQLGAENWARIEAIRSSSLAFRGGGGGGGDATAVAELHRLTDVDLPLQLNISELSADG